MPSTTLKTRVLAPMPAASVMSGMVVKSGERRRRRRTCLSCCRNDCMGAPNEKVAEADEEAATADWWLRERYEGGRGEVRGNFGGWRMAERRGVTRGGLDGPIFRRSRRD